MDNKKNIVDFERLHYSGPHHGLNPAITDSSTYWFNSGSKMAQTFKGETSDFLYGRHSSPSGAYLEKSLATLEGTAAAHVTASGMGAISATLFQLCQSGDEIISGQTVYGGSYALMKYFLTRFSITTKFVNTTQPDKVKAAITEKTKVIYCESVSNPLMEVAHIKKLAKIAHRYGLKLVIDNTFSPLSLTPAHLGADIIIHSLTKYINGAGDGIGGAICGSTGFINQLRDVNEGATLLLGATLDNFRAASILKNLKTLPVRIIQHSKNAAYIATHLEKEGFRVIYPGLKSHPNHQLYQKYANKKFGFGGMFTLDAGSKKKAFALMEKMQERKLGHLAVSLGHYSTLFSNPGTGTSSEIPEEERKEMGLTDSLIRFSIGLDSDIESTCALLKDCMGEVGL